MRKVLLTSEWLTNWKSSKRQEVADRGCPGLVARIGPSGTRTFYRFRDVRDEATGKVKRQRVKLGNWPALSLGDAHVAAHDARETRKPEAGAGALLTVSDLAERYRKDILEGREPASLKWSWGIIKTHILAAVPDKKRPPFGEWPAREVTPDHVGDVIRLAKIRRTVEVPGRNGSVVSRRLGGSAVARAALCEVKAIFGAALGSGKGSGTGLTNSPAAVLKAVSLGLKGKKRGRYLNEEELKALFAALGLNAILDGTAKPQKLSETVRLAIALLYYVPVRSHSLIAAEWKEIDLDAGRYVIPVAKQKLHADDRPLARPFTAPLPATAVAILRKLKELAGTSRWVLASPVNPKQHVGAKALIRALARLQENGRLEFGSKLNVHDARRTWRTWAGDLGVAFEVAERQLAHKLPGVSDVYAKAELIDKRAEAAELVGAAFDRVRLGTAATVVPIESAVRSAT